MLSLMQFLWDMTVFLVCLVFSFVPLFYYMISSTAENKTVNGGILVLLACLPLAYIFYWKRKKEEAEDDD